jgi:quercetin dioxygenase-like cupin family protein
MSNEDVIYAATDGTAVTTPEGGLERQVLAYNPRLMPVRYHLAKGWKGTRHKHLHDQLVYVVRGAIVFSGGGKTVEMHDGDSVVVAGDVEHEARAPEETEVCVHTVSVGLRVEVGRGWGVVAREGWGTGWCVVGRGKRTCDQVVGHASVAGTRSRDEGAAAFRLQKARGGGTAAA